ncbi:MAG: choice-of-anchor Q domain-containing protein [Isosphaeraceae bacterium]|nr:choice-of-anchor Q domain-containing protein [Isosphaeraceae bacterium]
MASKFRSPRCSTRRSRVLQPEMLESRVVLSTFTVTNTADKGTGSLRDAIARAKASVGADVIVFDAKEFATDRVIELSTTLKIDDGHELTIEGPTGSTLTIDGRGKVQIFSIDSTATLRDLRLTRGDAAKGGAIAASGRVVIERLSFEDNEASQGGAIYADKGSNLEVFESSFVDNQANAMGGAISTREPILVQGSRFVGNESVNGGAIAGDGLKIVDSTFIDNEAVSQGGALRGAWAVISGSLFEGNEAGTHGGAIEGSNHTIQTSEFVGNQAKSYGGALLVSWSTIQTSTFTKNSSGATGGAISADDSKILGSTFVSNQAGHDGGAVQASRSTIEAVTAVGNVAGRDGGAFALRDSRLSHATVVDNQADLSAGGVSAESNSIIVASIIAGNRSKLHPDLELEGKGEASTHNLIGIGSADSVQLAGVRGNLVGTPENPIDPRLGPLADNGGPTRTMALLEGSPAINAGVADGLTHDQRGESFTGVPDIGAVEREGLSIQILSGDLVITGTSDRDTITIGVRSATHYFVTTAIGSAPSTTIYIERAGISRIELIGGAGDDGLYLNHDVTIPATIRGGDGNDNLRGGGGNDQLLGEAGDDALRGGLGDDILLGGTGADHLMGQEGNDQLFGGTEDARPNQLDGGDGADLIHGSHGNDSILGGYNNGRDGGDTIYGHGGDDLISGAGGADTIFGGDGNDSINGGVGDDEIHGEAGNDQIHAVDGHDLVSGGDGNDVLTGGSGDDVIIGGEGVDRIDGESGSNILIGGSTTHDHEALEEIHREWSRAGESYEARIARLHEGVGADKSIFLDINTLIDDLALDIIKTSKTAKNWILA